jgi:two-component system NtrC family response regulator
MGSVLIVDGDRVFSEMLRDVATGMEHDALCASTIAEGLDAVRLGHFDIVFLGAQMPDGSGLDALPQLLDAGDYPEVIVVSDSGNPDEAELAIKKGAWDYIDRPSSQKQFVLPLVRALQYRAKRAFKEPTTILTKETFEGIVGDSPQIRKCLETLAQAANSDASVLITGETGTGKELFAKAIHENSPRAAKNFVVVDCAALPDTLVESTLFGHERGAFTGAEKAHVGLIKQADGGTLFLDEVGELTLSVQKNFLRVLEELRFRPVGAKEDERSNFRLIAASNRDLAEAVRSRVFRKDLLFRLRSFSIVLPPVRERRGDIEALVRHYIAQLCNEYGVGEKGFSPEFFEVLNVYDWPGNVRELVKALETAIVIARDEPILFPKHLPTEIHAKATRALVAEDNGQGQQPRAESSPERPLPQLQVFRQAAVARAEVSYLKNLVSQTKGNIKEACRISGLSRSRLYELLKKYGISTSGQRVH